MAGRAAADPRADARMDQTDMRSVVERLDRRLDRIEKRLDRLERLLPGPDPTSP